MVPHVIPGGMYVDAWPTGEWVALVPHQEFQSHLGNVALPPQEGYGLMFPVCSPVGEFHFGGQAHDTTNPASYEWRASTGWESKPPPCVGVWAAIYDRAGMLHTSDGSIGSQGWRYVDDDGRLIPGDATLRDPISQLDEYTVLPSGLKIGQGQDGGVWVWDGIVRRLLHPGDCFAIRAHQIGDQITVAFYAVVGGQPTAYIYHGSQAEFQTLPVAAGATATPPVSVPPPSPSHSPAPSPEPSSVSIPSQLDTVRAVRAKYPTPLGDKQDDFLLEVAHATGGQLLRKDGGSHVLLPNGTYVASDILVEQGEIFDILTDSEGAGSPQWNDDGPLTGQAVDVSQVFEPTDPPAPEPTPAPASTPTPVPSAPPAALIDLSALEVGEAAIVSAIQAASAAQIAKLDEIKVAFEKSVGDLKASLPAVFGALAGSSSGLGGLLGGLIKK